MILGFRNRFFILRNITSTHIKIKHTEEAISKLEQKRIKLVTKVRQSKRANHRIQFIQEPIEHIDRCIRARRRHLAKHKRNLRNLQLELTHTSRKKILHYDSI